ncbi:MAG: transposase [Porticoccaceae bacterium]
MPRKARMFLPDVPCHVITRGNNRDACFYADDDYLFHLECLSDACHKHRVAVHAYVLMTNHVHLLLTPRGDEGVLKVMQSIGRRYVQYINRTYRRSGTLWEGRYKASLVDAENYLMACYRYIELNPVRASMVSHPGDYRWSSYGVNAGLRLRKRLEPQEVYLRLGPDEKSRCYAYRELFSIGLDKSQLHEIQRASAFSMPLGNSRFQEQIERALNRKLGHAKRGRPKASNQVVR